jgi:hypothetical protein
LIPLNADGGLQRTMPPDVSRHKLRHREGSKIAPKHARSFCCARSRETMRKQSMRRLGRRIASPSVFPGTEIGRLRCDGDGLLIGETRPPARGRDRAQAPID